MEKTQANVIVYPDYILLASITLRNFSRQGFLYVLLYFSTSMQYMYKHASCLLTLNDYG